MMEAKHFLDVLFDGGEYLCLGFSAFDTATEPIATLSEERFLKAQFVSINPFIPGTTRKDINVQTFRNIMFEFDSGTLDEQADYIEQLQIPFTTLVYSGGKSLHCIVSLEQPCRDKSAYDNLVQDLYTIVTRCDPTGKNASRFTRLGGVQRPDKESEQTIIDITRRIRPGEIQAFINRHRGAVEAARHLRAVPDEIDLDFNAKGELSVRTKDILRLGLRTGSRRRELYIAACDFKNQGFSLDETFSKLLRVGEESGLSVKEAADQVQRGYAYAKFRPRILKWFSLAPS